MANLTVHHVPAFIKAPSIVHSNTHDELFSPGQLSNSILFPTAAEYITSYQILILKHSEIKTSFPSMAQISLVLLLHRYSKISPKCLSTGNCNIVVCADLELLRKITFVVC